MSAFLLLGCGILLTIVLLLAEHFYFRFCRKHLMSKEREKDPCFTLISLVSSAYEFAGELATVISGLSDFIWRPAELSRTYLHEFRLEAQLRLSLSILEKKTQLLLLACSLTKYFISFSNFLFPYSDLCISPSSSPKEHGQIAERTDRISGRGWAEARQTGAQPGGVRKKRTKQEDERRPGGQR